jgi:predicted Kef-type K+ transport protein
MNTDKNYKWSIKYKLSMVSIIFLMTVIYYGIYNYTLSQEVTSNDSFLFFVNVGLVSMPFIIFSSALMFLGIIFLVKPSKSSSKWTVTILNSYSK